MPTIYFTIRLKRQSPVHQKRQAAKRAAVYKQVAGSISLVTKPPIYVKQYITVSIGEYRGVSDRLELSA